MRAWGKGLSVQAKQVSPFNTPNGIVDVSVQGVKAKPEAR
jgi:hypothetical protein